MNKHQELGLQCMEIMERLKSMPPSRELSLAYTKLEEASHWIGADHAKHVERDERVVKP